MRGSKTKSKKLRRDSGRVEVYSDDEDYPTHFTFYDNWIDFRDGQRYNRDKSRIRSPLMCYPSSKIINSQNNKLKRMALIRKARIQGVKNLIT